MSTMKAIWEYIHGYAPSDKPESITFYDYQDETLYRDVALKIIGSHGWELVTVLETRDPDKGGMRYEYWFKRNRAEGYPEGRAKRRGD